MAVCPNCHEQNPEVGASCPRCDDFYYIPDEAVADAQGDPLIGRMTAEKYVILSLINEGGMGAVYRALQLPVEREVAFKVLRTELKDSDNGRDRFIREARAVSRLNHPNIITLYDFGFDNGKHPYMVMEYAPGQSVGKWSKQESITMERILRVTAQILAALTEAHSRGIVHRDLKPENMIVSQKGNEQDYVKLLDFGIARMINEGATRGLTREGEVFGTPHYMAPEQAQGKKEVGPPADIYAVGIMMWEMISGHCPFDAPTPLAVLFMHISDELPPLRPKPGILPNPEVEQIIRRACAKDPMDRYQTANEMLNDILAIIGFSGILPGMMGTDASAEFGSNETRRAAALSGSNAARAPHFTPSPSQFGSGVGVVDPDPSLVTSFDSGDQERVAAAAAANRRLAIIAALAVVAVVGAGIALVMIASSEPNEAQATVTQPTTEPPAEVAANDDLDAIEIEPIDEAVAAPAEEVEEPDIDAKEAAAAAAAAALAAKQAEEERVAAERKQAAAEQSARVATQKKTVEKPVEKKPVQKAAVSEKKPEKKTTESKDTAPKPGKWTVKPKRWD